MSATVRVIRDTKGRGLDELARRLRMGSPPPRELVGVPSGAKESDGTSLAQVAAWTEFGHPGGEEGGKGAQPERPFMRGGIRAGLPKIRRVARQDLAAVAGGHMGMATALDRMGAVGAGEIKRFMVGDNFAPNAPSTIARKGSDQPTIDSGSLRQQITHVPENV
jgi:hypothetical protein